jgi:hypothetical protein
MMSWGAGGFVRGGPRKGPRRAAGTRRLSGGQSPWRRDVDC